MIQGAHAKDSIKDLVRQGFPVQRIPLNEPFDNNTGLRGISLSLFHQLFGQIHQCDPVAFWARYMLYLWASSNVQYF